MAIIQAMTDTNESTRTTNFEISSKMTRLAVLEVDRTRLLDDYMKNKNQTSETVTCPHCQKPFSLHESLEHKKIVDGRLADIQSKGLKIKVEKETLTEELEPLRLALEKKTEKVVELQKQRSQIDVNIETVKKDIANLQEKQRQTVVNIPTLTLDNEITQGIKLNIQTAQNGKNEVLTNYQKPLMA